MEAENSLALYDLTIGNHCCTCLFSAHWVQWATPNRNYTAQVVLKQSLSLQAYLFIVAEDDVVQDVYSHNLP